VLVVWKKNRKPFLPVIQNGTGFRHLICSFLVFLWSLSLSFPFFSFCCGFLLQCGRCLAWWHAISCAKITMKRLKEIKKLDIEWYCAICRPAGSIDEFLNVDDDDVSAFAVASSSAADEDEKDIDDDAPAVPIIKASRYSCWKSTAVNAYSSSPWKKHIDIFVQKVFTAFGNALKENISSRFPNVQLFDAFSQLLDPLNYPQPDSKVASSSSSSSSSRSLSESKEEQAKQKLRTQALQVIINQFCDKKEYSDSDGKICTPHPDMLLNQSH
jgi:hypothetical protein